MHGNGFEMGSVVFFEAHCAKHTLLCSLIIPHVFYLLFVCFIV